MYRTCSRNLTFRLRLVCPTYDLWHALHVILYIPLFSCLYYDARSEKHQNRCTNLTNLFCDETLHVSDSSSVWHIPLLSVQWINSWWWTHELSETCRVSSQNKFVKLVHLVGFIIKRQPFSLPSNGFSDYFTENKAAENISGVLLPRHPYSNKNMLIRW
jgi:hypothetical protein